MKIVFMGTPDFAVPALKALAESDKHQVTLVVTQPDRPKGRSGKPAPSDVKQCALEYGIPVFQPEKIRDKEAADRLYAQQADIFVVAAFGQILPREILEMPRYGCVNIHGSLLPKYRGAAPIQWAVLNGEKEAGNTIMQMNEGLDTGDILTQESIPLDEKETAGSLYEKLSQMGGPLLLKTLDLLEEGKVTPVPQDNEQSCYAKMLRKEMGQCQNAPEGNGTDRLESKRRVHQPARTRHESVAQCLYPLERQAFENLDGLGGVGIRAGSKDFCMRCKRSAKCRTRNGNRCGKEPVLGTDRQWRFGTGGSAAGGQKENAGSCAVDGVSNPTGGSTGV